MINKLWFYMIVASIIYGIFFGDAKLLTEGILEASKNTVELSIQFIGVWALWLGLMEIIKESKLIDKIARLLYPLLKLLFPEIPKGDNAFGAIALNLSANILGLGNAATPFGLQAMNEMQKLNNDKEVAMDSMCMFLVINTSSVQLIPITVIAIRSSLGSNNPTSTVLVTLIATSISTLVGVTSSIVLKKRNRIKGSVK